MAFIDLFLGALLVYGILRGIWNGFFIEFASQVSLLLGIWVAIKFSHLARVMIEGHVSWNPKSVQIAAFALTFLAVVVGISLLTKFLTTAASFAGLGIVNKVFGGVFGLIKMILIISITLNLFARLNSAASFVSEETTEKSLFYNPIRNAAAFLFPTLEEWFSDVKEIVK